MSVFFYSKDEEPVVTYKAILKKKPEEKLGRSLTDSEFWDNIAPKPPPLPACSRATASDYQPKIS